MTVIRRIAELDALPNGSTVIGLDPQQTVVHKAGGHWVDLNKPAGTTWNVRTYVMARRWGVRVASPERNPEVNETVKTSIIALIEQYEAREAERQAQIDSYLDEEGDVDTEKYTYEEFDETVDDNAQFAREDLQSLLAELRTALNAPAQV
ncbi:MULTISPECIES: hypothetical protein [Streptomyces]|uniref:hypothetical protein n=1 Tax=Streptomyces TaxID=1883 RepID=UPI00368938BD